MSYSLLLSMNIPPHISRIGLFTGHMYLVGAAISHIYDYPIMVMTCSTIYGTTMVHWHNIKSSGIAKTVDMIAVVSGILIIAFHESYKFPGNGRKIWNSSILISVTTYLFNTVVFNFQNDYSTVPQEQPQEQQQKDEEEETSYNYFSLKPIPPNSPNREKMFLYTTIVHTFVLHILPITVGAYCVMQN